MITVHRMDGNEERLLGEAGLVHYDSAIGTLKRAVAIDPKLPIVYYGLALCYQQKLDYHNAIAMCKQATDIDPKFTLAYAAWADILEAIGDDDGASVKRFKALEISPQDRKSTRLNSSHLGISYA